MGNNVDNFSALSATTWKMFGVEGNNAELENFLLSSLFLQMDS
jgi:hypothetical protein